MVHKKWNIVNVEAAIYKEDQWLLMKRSEREEHGPGLITLVGGKVEEVGSVSDILEKTLHREVMEEVGIEVQNLHYLESKAFLTGNNEPIVDIVFVCEHKNGEAQAVDENEVAEIFWMRAIDIILSKEIPYFVKETIEKAEMVRIEKMKQSRLAIQGKVMEEQTSPAKKYRIRYL